MFGDGCGRMNKESSRRVQGGTVVKEAVGREGLKMERQKLGRKSRQSTHQHQTVSTSSLEPGSYGQSARAATSEGAMEMEETSAGV